MRRPRSRVHHPGAVLLVVLHPGTVLLVVLHRGPVLLVVLHRGTVLRVVLYPGTVLLVVLYPGTGRLRQETRLLRSVVVIVVLVFQLLRRRSQLRCARTELRFSVCTEIHSGPGQLLAIQILRRSQLLRFVRWLLDRCPELRRAVVVLPGSGQLLTTEILCPQLLVVVIVVVLQTNPELRRPRTRIRVARRPEILTPGP